MPIYTAVIDDETRVVCVALPTDPYEEPLILLGDDTSTESKNLLLELESHWPDLWPEMLRLLKDRMKGLNIDVDLATKEFTGQASKMEPGYFMSDQTDTQIVLYYGEFPEWHYFLRANQIVHFQHVY